MSTSPSIELSKELPLLVFIHGSADLYGSDKVFLNIVSAYARHGRYLPCAVLHEDGPLRARLAAAGVEVHVRPVGKITRAMLGPRAPFVLISALLRAKRDFESIVRGRRVALVYSNTLAVLGGAFWAWRRKLPHLWHVHEIVVSPAAVGRGLAWLVGRTARTVICNSKRTRDWLLLQVPDVAERTHVVFNGMAPLRRVQPHEVQGVREQISVPADAVLVTLAGRLNRMKGQSLLIDALALLMHQGGAAGAELHLLIVGDTLPGQEHIKQVLQQRVASAGLRDRVHFLPFAADIAPVWAATDVACVPSTEPESFGLVAIEAMSLGKPVVAAAHGGILDIVLDRKTGLLFKPRSTEQLAAALATLAADAHLRSALGAAGLQRQLSEFNLSQQVSRIQDLCEATIAS